MKDMANVALMILLRQLVDAEIAPEVLSVAEFAEAYEADFGSAAELTLAPRDPRGLQATIRLPTAAMPMAA